MADYTYIANAALDRVGSSQILSLDDQTESARKAKLHIYESIRKVLRMGKWKSATKRASLARSATAPSFGWSYYYPLPVDFLRMVSLNNFDAWNFSPSGASNPVYAIEGKRILTNETLVDMVYVADLTLSGNDINVTDAALTELFILQLAVTLCWPLQQSRTLRESLMQEMALVRRAALAADAQDTRDPLINRLGDSEWLRERCNSTNG